MAANFNKYQSSIEDLELSTYPEEVQEQFWDFLNNVPYIKWLISEDRPHAKDLPRDSEGKIIVDLTQPHIIEDMDYFRPSAIHFQKYGRYTDLKPNPNPHSEFGKWIREEARRCHEGYVRESDGEWIPGDYYYFLNYCPMSLIKKTNKNSKKGMRVIDFPKPWEGHYLKYHYLYKARETGHHAGELASRSKGKSFCGAGLLSKRFVLGESKEVNKKVTCYATASDKKYLVAGDQTLDKFLFDIDWCADHTEFPSKRLISALKDMQWIMGYKDLDKGTNQGTLNSVIGVTSKDDESKLRGTRGVLYIIEEWGTFPRLLEMYNNILKSVEDGEDVFGIIYAYGTAGDDESDFRSAQEIMYHPEGYHMQPIKNVYDKIGQGRPVFVYFFPGYMNLAGCYNENGVSDVTKALLQILNNRFIVKYNSTDPKTIVKTVAEVPVTPQEAVLRSRGNLFPITQLNERLNEIDNDPGMLSDVAVGDLVFVKGGKVQFIPTNAIPIRNYPLKDNKNEGAIEFYAMPEKSSTGMPAFGRYIGGVDPIDDDVSNTMSLVSIFILDTWTDKIVCEWTGRLSFADDCYERCRRIAIFYNAQLLYENDKKGMFAYFSKTHSLQYLADIPEYLKSMYNDKVPLYGNKLKGYKATAGINAQADVFHKDWLNKMNTYQDAQGNSFELPNLSTLKCRALIQEEMNYNPVGNFDRIRAFGAVMLLREEKLIMYGNSPSSAGREKTKSAVDDGGFFDKNYDEVYGNLGNLEENEL